MAGAMFLKASAVVAALCLVELTATAFVCPTSIPAATFNFPQSYQGNEESFDWLISLTTPSTNTPAGDAACASAVYVGQYSPGSADPAACITTVPTGTVTGAGCEYKTTQKDGSTTRTFDIIVECDANANTLTPPTSFVVTTGFGSSAFIYTGTFKSAAVCGGSPPGPTPPGPTPPGPPGPNPAPGGAAYEKEPCSGGCAFLIVFFVGMFVYFVVAIVFNIVTGKRGREAAPHTDFWSEIPSLVKDGVMFLFRVITCRASAGAGYQQV